MIGHAERCRRMGRISASRGVAIRRLPALLLVALLALSTVSHTGARQDDAAPRYKLVPLGTIKDYASTIAYAVNAKGVVVGQGSNLQTGTARAVTFKSGKLKALIKGEKNPQSFAQDINASGQIVINVAENGTIRALFWDSNEGTTITVSGSDVRAQAVNDSGLVVGVITTFGDTFSEQPYTWQDGEFTELDLLEDSVGGLALNVNADGLVVGQVTLAEQPDGWQPRHAVAWNDGAIVDLGTIAGHFSGATGVNASGQIVGSSTTAEGQGMNDMEAALWEDGEVAHLGVLGDDGQSNAMAINAQGDIVGASSSIMGGNAVFWRGGEIYNLNELIDDAGDVQLDYAVDINDDGLIVALDFTQTGEMQSYLLEPVGA